MHTPRTRRLDRLASLLFSALLVGALAAPAAAAPPPIAVYTFPGCAPTLQGCINGAPDGARIELATNGPIAETVNVQRSLQLVAAAGYSPVFAPFARVLAVGAAGMPRHLVLHGLTWEPAGSSGAIEVVHGTDAPFDVEITGNRFLGVTGASGGSTVVVRTTGIGLPPKLGRLTLLLADNELDAPVGDTNPISLSFTRGFDGVARIERNRIRTAGFRQQSAVDVYHTDGELRLEVTGNLIASANPGECGLDVYQTGTGTGRTIARVANNVMTGFDGGMRFGAGFYAENGSIDLTVVHNTITHAGRRAVQVGGRPDVGGEASGIIANNVLVWSERSDVGIHEFGETVRERRNLVTRIGGADDTPSAPSPDTIVVPDPQFVGPDDFRLAPSSAGINTASAALLPEGLTTDAAGHPRIAGPAPDMGAFELPCDAGSSAPHCLAQPSCEETGCETVDPCRPAACLNDRCLETTLVGFPAAQCVCARDLPASCPTTPRLSGVARRVARACASLGLAADPARARQQGRFLAKAQRTFDRARLQVGRRAVASQIPAACATDLDVDLRDAVERVGWLIK